MKLITEMSNNIVTESIDKSLYVLGVFSSAEVKNNNNRTYKKDLLNREVEKLTEQVNSNSLYGQLNHPTSPEINLEKVAILVESLKWQGNDLLGKAKVLENTHCGGTLKGILDAGGKVGISSRGLGTVSENGEVNEDFSLICWDIVADASNVKSQFVNGIYEEEEFYVKESEEIIKEKAFRHIWQVLINIEKDL